MAPERIVFWKNRDKKIVDPKLFSEKAENLAKELARDNENSKGGKENKRTQLRKFYDEILRLDSRAQAKREEWENVEPYLHMLVAKAAYARGRELVSTNFLNFIKSSIGQISNKDDLDVFARFFEAFMGFYRLHGPRN